MQKTRCIAGSDHLLQVIDAGVLPELIMALQSVHAPTQHAAAWAALHTAAHGTHTANQIASAGILPPLLALYASAPEGSERRGTAKAAIKEVMARCNMLAPALALIGVTVPPEIASHALLAAHRVLQTSVAARREFVTTGALMAMQQLEQGLDAKGQGTVQAVNALFPQDVVKYYRQDVARDAAARGDAIGAWRA